MRFKCVSVRLGPQIWIFFFFFNCPSSLFTFLFLSSFLTSLHITVWYEISLWWKKRPNFKLKWGKKMFFIKSLFMVWWCFKYHPKGCVYDAVKRLVMSWVKQRLDRLDHKAEGFKTGIWSTDNRNQWLLVWLIGVLVRKPWVTVSSHSWQICNKTNKKNRIEISGTSEEEEEFYLWGRIVKWHLNFKV